MTTTSDRIIRAKAQSRNPSHFALTERQRERHERIVDISQYLLAEEGFHNITFRGLARGLRLTTAALRFHFTDMEALLAEILRRHLHLLAAALGKYEPTDPTRHQKRRAAYLAYTRTALGGLAEAHLLLVRDSHVLPDDERASIDMMRQGLAELLAGPANLPDEVLQLLDTPSLNPARIEAYLAAPITKSQPPQPQTAEPQTTKTPEPLTDLEEPNAWNNPGSGEKPGAWVFTAGIPLQCPAPTLAA